MDNTGPSGNLNTDAFQRAILHYRNTPDKETGISPAQCIFGRPIRDFIPIHPGRFEPHPTWKETLLVREETLRNRHMKMAERLSEHTKKLPLLKVGNKVRIQNQTGPHPTKWDKTGMVVEVRQFDQYLVKVDGSGRVTLRNRKFLRSYVPAIPEVPIHNRSPLPIPQYHKPKDITPANPEDSMEVQGPEKPESFTHLESETPVKSQPNLKTLTPPSTPISPLPEVPNNEPTPVCFDSNIPCPKKIPKALSRLTSHNNKGKAETNMPMEEERTTRSSKK